MKRLFQLALLGLFFMLSSTISSAQNTQLARSAVSFPPLTNNGTTGPIHTRGTTKVRVGIACQYNTPPPMGFLPSISWQLTGVTTNSRNIALEGGMINQSGADPRTTATTLIDVPTESIKADFAVGNHGTPLFCEVTVYGDMPFQPRPGKIASETTGVLVSAGRTYMTDLIDVGEYEAIRIAYDSQSTTAGSTTKAPLVTVIGVFDGDEVPVENLLNAGIETSGGSTFLRTPPAQIKLMFKNQETATKSIKVRWYVYGVKKPPIQ